MIGASSCSSAFSVATVSTTADTVPGFTVDLQIEDYINVTVDANTSNLNGDSAHAKPIHIKHVYYLLIKHT